MVRFVLATSRRNQRLQLFILSFFHDGEPNKYVEMDIMAHEKRPTWPAVWNGLRRKCPNCGKGQLLSGYLKVCNSCTVCHQELHHHKADDGPAYLTILIVGHLMAPLLHMAFVTFRPEPLVLFAVFAVGCVALSLYLLPRLKGAIVAIQWARSMHGF